MSARSIPPLIETVIAAIRWPLDPNASPPLHFQPLERMVEIRRNSVHHASSHAQELADNVLDTVSSLAGSSKAEKQYYARIATALLLLGHGYTDEAHSLVSPLSWTQATPFGYGPPVVANTDITAISSYAHSLVHRREGFHDSEYDMSGFGNAHFWASSTSRCPDVENLPFASVRVAVLEIASSKFEESKAVQQWVEKKLLKGDFEEWEPRLLHDLCSDVMGTEPDIDPELRRFAEWIAEAELRILLGHTLRKLGFDCDDFTRS